MCSLQGVGSSVVDDQVILRPVAEDDLELLERLLTDPEATGEHEWHGWQDTRWLRRRWDENGLLGEDRGILMAAREGEAIGFVSWGEIKVGYQSSCWMIGISLAPEARGHGYGTEVQRQLARYLFLHTQVNRVEAATEITNVAEQRALEKAGFTREGVRRGANYRRGQWRDEVIYSLLRYEVDL
jgi:RimJ/RimL family protein N-acetyltransferase